LYISVENIITDRLQNSRGFFCYFVLFLVNHLFKLIFYLCSELLYIFLIILLFAVVITVVLRYSTVITLIILWYQYNIIIIVFAESVLLCSGNSLYFYFFLCRRLVSIVEQTGLIFDSNEKSYGFNFIILTKIKFILRIDTKLTAPFVELLLICIISSLQCVDMFWSTILS